MERLNRNISHSTIEPAPRSRLEYSNFLIAQLNRHQGLNCSIKSNSITSMFGNIQEVEWEIRRGSLW
uniref:Uncharacterized protein n=1 Tax=Arundo donax TaxID=35708 RepID=A0A0A8ZK28_ARUDO